jgi:hypothetical protein
MHHLATKEHTMFVPTRRKTAGNQRPSANVRPISETAPVLNHWAWTGWMPEAEPEPRHPALPAAENHPALLAA